MNRRNFLTASSLLLITPLKSVSAQEEVCLTGLQGVDIESSEGPQFSHFHQLIIPVSDLVNPPADGIQLMTSVMDQGSYDSVGLERYASENQIDLTALKNHDHIVRITAEELMSISNGDPNVEIKVYTRDGSEYVHSFFVTAPPSLLAIVRKERP